MSGMPKICLCLRPEKLGLGRSVPGTKLTRKRDELPVLGRLTSLQSVEHLGSGRHR